MRAGPRPCMPASNCWSTSKEDMINKTDGHKPAGFVSFRGAEMSQVRALPTRFISAESNRFFAFKKNERWASAQTDYCRSCLSAFPNRMMIAR